MAKKQKGGSNHPEGIECIQVVRYMNYNLGTALRHLWEANQNPEDIDALHQALFFIYDEIEKRKRVRFSIMNREEFYPARPVMPNERETQELGRVEYQDATADAEKTVVDKRSAQEILEEHERVKNFSSEESASFYHYTDEE